jgi:hypothetical protein
VFWEGLNPAIPRFANWSLDNGLAAVAATADRLCICTSEPAGYSDLAGRRIEPTGELPAERRIIQRPATQFAQALEAAFRRRLRKCSLSVLRDELVRRRLLRKNGEAWELTPKGKKELAEATLMKTYRPCSCSRWRRRSARSSVPVSGWTTAVALSADGNIAIIGGPGDNPWDRSVPFGLGAAGAAWVFTRIGDVWTQQGNKLVGGTLGGANQGTSVALSADGTTAIVGRW